MFGFTDEQIYRYSRQIILPEMGGQGQHKLLEARVLVVGAGGLGSPAVLYLAAAGVGTLGLVDFDVVEISNLHRQILHRTQDIGRPKTESAWDTIQALNPDVKVNLYQQRLCSENALELFADYDVVVNGSDNFPTRYLVNDAAVISGRPVVDGSVFQFDGQVTVYKPREGPCYRCPFPVPPPPGSVPSCQEAGVLGVLPGIIGSIQALETMKLILGIGEPLVGRLLIFNALRTDFHEVLITRNSECAVCGDNPTVTKLIDYEDFCGLRERSQAVTSESAI